MTIPVIQSLVAKDGKYIVLPVWVSGDTKYGNLAHPNPHANSSVGDTAQQYPHGTKFVDGDRVFFYGKVYSVYLAGKSNLGMFNLNESASGTGTVTWGATAGVKGDTQVGILASGLTDTTPDEDDFAGGWFMPRTNPYSSYRVLKSSTAAGARVSGEIDLTLDYGLVESVTASQASCFLNFSEWTKLSQQWTGSIDYATCPGVTLVDPIASTWQWVQSWGPCYVVPYNEEIGASVHNHDCFFWMDGTVLIQTRGTGALDQKAGYMLNCSGSATTSTWLIRLQINR